MWKMVDSEFKIGGWHLLTPVNRPKSGQSGSSIENQNMQNIDDKTVYLTKKVKSAGFWK